MAFGVTTTNMFELLGDGENDVAPTSAPSKPPAESKKANPATTGAASVEARLKGSSGSTVNGGRGRGEGRGGRAGRGGRGGFDRPIREDGAGEGAEDRNGPRQGRGRGGSRHFERDRRRGYDRHDNSGRGHETEKRGGGGGHNWGAVGEGDPAAVEEARGGGAEWKDEEVVEEAPQPEVSTPAEAAPVEEAIEAEPKEPEVEELTLDEYLKKMEEKKGNLKKKPVNDVKVDTKAFEGMKVYNPKEKEADDSELELSEKKLLGKSKTGLTEKARKEKELLPTSFRVGGQESGRGGRGRGDRGGRSDRPERERPPRRVSDENSAGRGSGRGRSDRPYSGGRGRGEHAPSLDEKSFPSLGGN